MKQAIPPKIDFLIKMPKDTLKKGVFFSFFKKNLTFLKKFCQNAHFSTSNRYNIYRRVFQKTQRPKIFSKRKATRQQLLIYINNLKSIAFRYLFLSCVSATKKKPKLNLKGGFLFMRSFTDLTIKKQNETQNCDSPKINENSARYRTINATIKELKEIDPNTCLSTYFIRCLCSSKKVISLTAGNKVLVNFDDLLNYLQKGER